MTLFHTGEEKRRLTLAMGEYALRYGFKKNKVYLAVLNGILTGQSC